MKLVDLNPEFLNSGCGRRGVGVEFDCPCGNHEEDHRCYVPFAIALDGSRVRSDEKGWQRTGDTFDTLTLTPSVRRIGGCGWHGFITSGEVRTV